MVIKRKRILRKEVLDTLNGCLCGEVVNPLILLSDAIIKGAQGSEKNIQGRIF